MARSVTGETKAKFEALLKAALKKNESRSMQSLIEKSDDIGEDNNAIETKLEYDEEYEKIEKPVPKVRKKLLQQKSSDSDKASTQSNQTFTVEKDNDRGCLVKEELMKKTVDIAQKPSSLPSSSSSSRKTYNVNKEEIGDILVHDRKEIIQILKVSTNRNGSSISNTENEAIELEELKNKEVFSEAEKSDNDDEKTGITYEDELRAKRIKTKKKTKGSEEAKQTDDGGTYDKIVKITVHKTDRLKLNKFIAHPMVKIHIVNYETGEYIKKSNPTLPGVLHLENPNIDYLMPVMTQNFNLQQQRQLFPEWEEDIIVNESYKYFSEENRKTMLLFEVMDFVDFNAASTETDTSSGWHNIAWAFMKIVAGDGSTNTNRKLRLQLYKPGQTKKGIFCPVFSWWKQRRNKYPSSLYVTVKGILSPHTVIETFRPKTPLEKEIVCDYANREEINKIHNELKGDEKEKVQEVLESIQEQMFKLPNKIYTKLHGGDEGCFSLKFGNTGKYLACAILSKGMYILTIYLLPDLEDFFKLNCHQGLIYNITFSKDDSLILASSADGTVSIWELTKVKFLRMLPHPSFVYWCEISDDFVVTGCYDKIIRIWRFTENLSCELFEELEGHKGYITCMCINSNVSHMYSSDGSGVIICWKKSNENWKLQKKIILVELNNTVINQIILHKKEKRLIVHARDSILRILDIKNECVIHWLEGGVNNRIRTMCCLSPCNSYVFCGSESGSINVWNTETGKLAASYNTYAKLSAHDLPVHSLDFCPRSKMLAFSHFGHKIPIIVYTFDPITTDVDMRTFTTERKWKDVSQKIHSTRSKRSIESNEKLTDAKSVNLKEILDKIDKIIS